jgi:hypothetical protein
VIRFPFAFSSSAGDYLTLSDRDGGPTVDIILLDWTRMGRVYCLAGAIYQAGEFRIVRPLPARARNSPIANNGWSPYLMDGHTRWEVFELVRPEPANAQAPHLEDVWVHSLRPRKQLASRDQRLAILQATLAPPGAPIFGVELTQMHSGTCSLEPGSGERSLATVMVPSAELHFSIVWYDGQGGEPGYRYRVRLNVPGHPRAILPLTDHFLLCQAERHSEDVEVRLEFLAAAVRALGEQVCVRLGLSRGYSFSPGQPERCWLMADGFFSLDDPQC